MPTEALYDISGLAKLSGLTVRTIRYYIQERLLPSSGQRGPSARYGSDHLARLHLIRRLQAEHLPLAEIRRRLGSGDAAAAGEGPQQVAGSPGEARSAADYVRSVLGDSSTTAVASPKPTSIPGHEAGERSHWERIPLSGDVELHVRRPLSRVANRRVERLLEQARRILNEEP